jgi:hypothetical protein
VYLTSSNSAAGFQAAQLGFVVVGKVVYFTSSNSVAGFQALEEQLL